MSGLSESVKARINYVARNLTALLEPPQVNDPHEFQQQQQQHRDDSPTSDTSTVLAKVLAIFLLLIVTSICGFIPFALNRYFKWTSPKGQSARSATVVKCLLYFGGGVLLATTFLHLLPEVQEVCEDLLKCQLLPDLPFDLATVLMCGGFFLMYLIEELMHTYMHHRQNAILKQDKDGAAFERGHSVRKSVLVKESMEYKCNGDHGGETSDSQNSSMGSTAAIVQRTASDKASNESLACPKYESDNNNQDHNHNHKHEEEHSHLPVMKSDDDLASSLRGLGLVLALSLHEVFEGLAIGLESTNSAVWFTCGAVAAHKLVLAFCVGMELVVAKTRKSLAIVYIVTFSIVSPIGIAIGILISMNSTNATPSMASAILQGIACGTLLYVVFFEILSKNHAGWWAYLTLLLGFGLMFGLQILGHDADSHSGEEYSCAA